MRTSFAAIFILLIVLLGLFGTISRRSNKTVAKIVSYVQFCFLIPITGNLILLLTQNELLARIGIHIYSIGMNLVAFTLFRFTLSYCNIPVEKHRKKCYAIYTVLALDIVQYLISIYLGYAIDLDTIMVDGTPYYRPIPYLGQYLHRIIAYTTCITSMVIFLVKAIRVPRIYAEKYYVIFFTMFFTGSLQTYYILSKTPVDFSMLALAICAVLIFYFSLFFRPFRLLDRMLANIASKNSDAIFFFDANNRCIWINSNAQKLINCKHDDLENVHNQLSAMFKDWGENAEEWSSKQTSGSGKETRFYTLEKQVVKGSNDKKVGSFLTIQDNTENVLKHQREIYDATHDKLTGLYTKEYLFSEIRKCLSEKQGTSYCIAYLDIRNFKMVNDIYGKDAGDKILIRVAEWIKENSNGNWIFGRLSGDAFGVCFSAESVKLPNVERRLRKFVISNGNIDHHILMHVGIYNVIDPDMDISIMFDRAHLALTTIKNEYNKHIAIYNDNMRDQLIWDQKISAELENAIEKREIVPYLQPIVNKEGSIIGAEALVRWNHPEEGFLAPFKFIPVFEKNGMITVVDKYIWRCACETLSSWNGEKSNLFISINISPKDFYFMDVFAEINALVKEFKIPPSRLRIEITESVMMTDAESRLAILNKFRRAGFIVEMDDFGSGYSSLNQLKDMPFDVLKIDMMFLSKAQDDPKAATILRNVLRLSNDLGLISLSEGVETEAQYRILLDMGCHLFQGFYFAKPKLIKDFEEMLQNKK